MHAGVSEADSEQKGLVPLPSDGADAAGGNPASSSDEDTSDEAFAARHAVFEAEEQQRFNSFAGKPVVSASNPFKLGTHVLRDVYWEHIAYASSPTCGSEFILPRL